MATPDFEIIKEIPGYKVILKAVLKNQIQQLVEQLATYTDEESVILTASLSDGTLSHLGSTSGKSFLEDHEDVKSQFLGFCLKAHHRKKLEEKLEMERQEALLVPTAHITRPARFAGARSWRGYSPRSESYMSPQQPLHPFKLAKTSHRGHLQSPGVRHEPYPITKPSSNVDSSNKGQGTTPSYAGTKFHGQLIKIEPDNDNSDEASNQCDSNINTQNVSNRQQPSSPSQNSSSVRNSSSDNDDIAPSESTTHVNASTEALPEGLNLELDMSNLISGAQSFSNAPRTPGSGSDTEHIVSVKVEAVTESDMDLEITGLELARPIVSEDNWTQNGNSESSGGAIKFDLSENQGSIMSTSPVGSYNNKISGDPVTMSCFKHRCEICSIPCQTPASLQVHMRRHTGERPFDCKICGKTFTQKGSMNRHIIVHYNINK